MIPTVYAVKTLYPHWGEATGFNQLASFIEPAKVRYRERYVPMGAPKLFQPFLENAKKKRRRRGDASVYSPNDLLAEIRLFLTGLFRDVDIIHLFDAEHTLKHLPHWVAGFQSLRKFPRIISMLHQPPEIMETLVDMGTVARTDCVLVVSPCQKEYCEQTLPGTRVELIPLGVNTGHFTPVSPGQDGDGRFRCLAGGVWLRDYETLLRTAKLLQGDPEFEFHVVTPSLDVPSDLNNIFVHTGITDQEFLELYRACDLLFMPMQAATANNVILEGISCGLPVLSSDLPALRFYLPGEEAVLVKDNQPQAFAEVLRELKSDRSRLVRMAGLARQRALEFSWDKITRDYEALYASLFAGDERGH